MATPTFFESGNYAVAKWTGETGTGGAVNVAGYTKISVQGNGSAGTPTIEVEGSNDGTDWATLSDGTADITALADNTIAQVHETPIFIRPVVSAGTSTVTIKASR